MLRQMKDVWCDILNRPNISPPLASDHTRPFGGENTRLALP